MHKKIDASDLSDAEISSDDFYGAADILASGDDSDFADEKLSGKRAKSSIGGASKRQRS